LSKPSFIVDSQRVLAAKLIVSYNYKHVCDKDAGQLDSNDVYLKLRRRNKVNKKNK
jgi:hypothetical protein